MDDAEVESDRDGGALFYLPFTAMIVLAGIAAGVAEIDLSVALVPLALKNVFEELAWRGFGTRTAVAAGLPASKPTYSSASSGRSGIYPSTPSS